MTGGELRRGMRVRTTDGSELGRVVEIRGDTVTVEKGFFLPRRLTVAIADLSGIRDGDAWLAATREEVRLEPVEADRGAPDAPTVTWSDDRMGADELRVPVAEEEVVVEKRAREVGAVSVRKRVVTEQRQITVPVLREELVVERVPASGARGGSPDVRSDAAPFEERTLTIPLYEEEVEIVKRPRLREEVHLSKVVREVRHVEQAAVRRAEVDVEAEGAVRLHDEGPGSSR